MRGIVWKGELEDTDILYILISNLFSIHLFSFSTRKKKRIFPLIKMHLTSKSSTVKFVYSLF